MATDTVNHIQQYFARHPEFDYEPDALFLKEFKRLTRQMRWHRDKDRLKQERQALKDAMVKQFNAMYGSSEHDLHAWQALCNALGIDPIPGTIPECRQILKSTHVNLVDFVHRPNPEQPVKTFKSEAELSRYTLREEKVFPRSNVHAGSLLRCLLRQIMNPSIRSKKAVTQ